MSSNLIKTFYTAFSKGDAKTMSNCYHKDIIFEDPAFGKLKGERAGKMWEMLLSNKSSGLIITFDNVTADNEAGSADWKAEYYYGKKKRKVVNHIHAEFKFKDGKIIEHKDSFNLWKWTRQALGFTGLILGWTQFMKKKINTLTNQKLDEFIQGN